MRKKIHIASIIFLLCLGPAIFLHNEHACPSNIPGSAFPYTGRCADITVEVKYYAKQSRNMYVLSMEDGRKFWIDGLFSEKGDFSYTRFCDEALGDTVSLHYIDVNANWGSFAKEIVEIHNDTETFLAMDTVARACRNSRNIIRITYVSILIFWTGVVFLHYSDERARRKLTAHRQQTKAKRREWLDAHPKEKGAPPSARRKRGRK